LTRHDVKITKTRRPCLEADSVAQSTHTFLPKKNLIRPVLSRSGHLDPPQIKTSHHANYSRTSRVILEGSSNSDPETRPTLTSVKSKFKIVNLRQIPSFGQICFANFHSRTPYLIWINCATSGLGFCCVGKTSSGVRVSGTKNVQLSFLQIYFHFF
jgi:hypothetical protein